VKGARSSRSESSTPKESDRNAKLQLDQISKSTSIVGRQAASKDDESLVARSLFTITQSLYQTP
jgi:hypothetical protein